MNMFASLVERPQMHKTVSVRVSAPKAQSERVCRQAPPNPWGLTWHEWRVLAALSEVEGDRAVAARIGIGHKRVEEIMRGVKRKMGVGRVRAVLLWDRFHRSGVVPASKFASMVASVEAAAL